MRASQLIKDLENLIRYYGDLEISCNAGDDYFPSKYVEYSNEEDEFLIKCKNYNYGEI